MTQPSGDARRISVALPVYNGENYLEEALHSVLEQTNADFELVVSDNCSTDRTPEILAEIAAQDRRVRPSRSDRFLPQAANITRAIQLAEEPWVKLLCHDDLLGPDCLKKIVAVIPQAEAAGVGVIGNNESWLLEGGRRISARSVVGEAPMLVPGRKAVIGALTGVGPAFPLPAITTATVYKPAFLEAGGFDGRYVHFDVFFWMKLLTGSSYMYLPAPLTVNRIHGEQVAVKATHELRSVSDHASFIPAFLSEYREELALPRFLEFKARLKPATFAAKAVAIYLRRGRYREAVHAASACPKALIAALPFLVVRQLFSDRRRLFNLGGQVRFDELYPDLETVPLGAGPKVSDD